MKWKVCKLHKIKFKGDTCPYCLSGDTMVKFAPQCEVVRGLEDFNEDYIKRELGIK